MILLYVAALAYAQNISFCMVSRARNRNNQTYHMVAAILSNLTWFATFRVLVIENMDWTFFIPYLIGTVAGSLTGAAISERIEKRIGATS